MTVHSPLRPSHLLLHCLRKARHFWLWIHFLPSLKVRHPHISFWLVSTVQTFWNLYHCQDLKVKFKKKKKKERTHSPIKCWLLDRRDGSKLISYCEFQLWLRLKKKFVALDATVTWTEFSVKLPIYKSITETIKILLGNSYLKCLFIV